MPTTAENEIMESICHEKCTPPITLLGEVRENSTANGQCGEFQEKIIVNGVDANPGDGTITGNDRGEETEGDAKMPFPLPPHCHENEDRLLATEIPTDTTSKDSEINQKCCICGPPKGTSKPEYTKLSLFPSVQREVHELLKILTAPDDSDACCERCLGFMKTFIKLKNDFLSMKRLIISLNADAQLDLSKTRNHTELEEEGHGLNDQENETHNSDNQKQTSEVLIKKETIYGFGYEETCDRNLPPADECGSHESTHTGQRHYMYILHQFRCWNCNEKFFNKIAFLKHNEECMKDDVTSTTEIESVVKNDKKTSIDTGTKSITYLHCDKTFSKDNERTRHEKIHQLNCSYCDKSFMKTSALKRHEKIHAIYTCSHCDRTFKRKVDLVSHAVIHTDDRLKCKSCEKTFTRMADLVEHGKIHELKCHHCDKSCWGPRALKKHEKIHTDEKKHKCNHCGKPFAYRCYLKKHMEIHTGKIHTRKRKKLRATTGSTYMYTCSHCDRTFKRKVHLVSHAVIHKDDRLKCKSCEETFTRMADLVEHGKIHELICSHCGKSCWGPRALKKHEKIHTEKKKHKCNHCGKPFVYACYLKMHMRIHTGEKPYRCTYCTKSFALGPCLKIHIMNKHTGEKPYKCQYCERGFSVKIACIEHERTHTGERPFKCDFCDKSFKSRSHWLSHVKNHQGILKPLVCSYCGKRFTVRSLLVIHERTHTGEKPFKCNYCDKRFIRKNKCNEHERIHTRDKTVKIKPNQ
ncbi:zinc finger protein 2 homolog isoform X2 [Lingula anatina]|uniref:Zinc finger protein 2 homolog isoform X2 n=1 Tax=Lingula anatina TaxID=7574 RepID=A0A1S3KAZ8_LINAN|nr:zinc finger protein 2 homolog isoform X2 [Lingula anatina]|eukprot:XP_013419810.1 zinc finger protein 2 homolog isoform X2 [Lingula anatina]